MLGFFFVGYVGEGMVDDFFVYRIFLIEFCKKKSIYIRWEYFEKEKEFNLKCFYMMLI